MSLTLFQRRRWPAAAGEPDIVSEASVAGGSG